MERVYEMNKVFLILLILISNPIYLNATSLGVAGSDCGTFIKYDREDHKNWYPIYITAFQAYISALEWSSKKNKAEGLSAGSLYYSILRNCRDKPTERLDTILLEFYFEEL